MTHRFGFGRFPALVGAIAALSGVALAGTGCSEDSDTPAGSGSAGDAGVAGGSGGRGAGGGQGGAAAGGQGGAAGSPQGGGGTGGVTSPTPDTSTVTATIGAEGGSLEHPTGALLAIPPGALSAPVELSITGAAAPEQAVLGGAPLGQAFVLGPEGQSFDLPVTVSVPFDDTLLAGGGNARIRIAPRDSTEFVTLSTQVDSAAGLLEADTAHFSVVVPVAPSSATPLAIVSAPLADATVGQYYGPVTLEASGGTPPLVWTLYQGSLPVGMRFTDTGMISGTPQDSGTALFVVRLADSAGEVLEQAMTLNVVEPGAMDAGPIADGGSDPDGSVSGPDGSIGTDGGAGPELLYGNFELELVGVDATYLYFTQSGGSLSRLPLAGGTPEPITGFASAAGRFAMVGSYFYYSNGVNALMRQDKAGATEETVATAPGSFSLLGWDVFGSNAYIQYSTLIDTVPVTGGALTNVVDPGGNLIDVDGTWVLYSVYDGVQNVWAAPLDQSAPPGNLLPGANIGGGLLDGGMFYYALGGSIYRIDPAGAGSDAGSGELVASGGAPLLIDGGDLIYVDGTTVSRVPLAGGAVQPLGEAGNARLAADGNYVYFSSMYPTGGIFRVAR